MRDDGGCLMNKGSKPSRAAFRNLGGQRQKISVDPADQSQKEAFKYLDNASVPTCRLRRKSSDEISVASIAWKFWLMGQENIKGPESLGITPLVGGVLVTLPQHLCLNNQCLYSLGWLGHRNCRSSK